jgi:hypothetical protein
MEDRGSPRSASLRWLSPPLLLAALAGLAVVLLFSMPAITQDLAYHHFADQRTLLGIPNFWNVVSNAPFVFIGIAGIRFIRHSGESFRSPQERWPWLVLFLGIGLTGFGSAYYHWEPSNARLVWDRLPMTLAFMGLFAAVVGERISLRVGLALLVPLLAAGVGSVFWWERTDDLRPYYLVQFYPMAAIPLLVLVSPPRYTGTGYLFAALACYVLAKVFELLLDGRLFALGELLSGHTVKHLLAALGAYWLLHMLKVRRPIESES